MLVETKNYLNLIDYKKDIIKKYPKNKVEHFISSPDGRKVVKIYSNGIIDLTEVDNPFKIKRFYSRGESITRHAVEWESMHIIVVYSDQAVKVIDLNKSMSIADVKL